jgi:hypothetical protein
MKMKDNRTSPLFIAFWSFFTGIQLDRGIEKLLSLHDRFDSIPPFLLAFVCGLGVAISLWRTMRSAPNQ